MPDSADRVAWLNLIARQWAGVSFTDDERSEGLRWVLGQLEDLLAELASAVRRAETAEQDARECFRVMKRYQNILGDTYYREVIDTGYDRRLNEADLDALRVEAAHREAAAKGPDGS